LSAEPTAKPLTKSEILEAWHSRMVPLGFPAVAKMTGQRERQLRARLKDSTLEEWQRAMDALERSAFCRGENDRGWRADFDFLLQPKSFTKFWKVHMTTNRLAEHAPNQSLRASTVATKPDTLRMLAEDIAGFTHDPLGYAVYAFPWGEKGLHALADSEGARATGSATSLRTSASISPIR
jgi:hypothetical protein